MRAAPLILLLTLSIPLLLAGCSQDMWNGSRLKPLEGSPVFADGRASRPIPEDTVARGQLDTDTLHATGLQNGKPADVFPFPVTRAMLNRGQQRYDIYCRECHGASGDGDGIVVQRGFSPPPSYHTERLRRAPVGHFFDVITNGYGVMYPYNDRVRPDDRWAIAAYIRVLQLARENEKNEAAKPGPRAPLPTEIPNLPLPGSRIQGEAR